MPIITLQPREIFTQNFVADITNTGFAVDLTHDSWPLGNVCLLEIEFHQVDGRFWIYRTTLSGNPATRPGGSPATSSDVTYLFPRFRPNQKRIIRGIILRITAIRTFTSNVRAAML